MDTSLTINTETQNLVYSKGVLTLSNKDGSPLELPNDYVQAVIDPSDREIILSLKKAIEKPHCNQMQVIAIASLELETGNQTVKTVLKKYENLLWSFNKDGKGKQSQAFKYFLINKQ